MKKIFVALAVLSLTGSLAACNKEVDNYKETCIERKTGDEVAPDLCERPGEIEGEDES